MNEKTLCIYHHGCADGFAAAWVVRQFYKEIGLLSDVEFVPGIYGEVPPDVTGRHVLLVDFSYKRPVLEAMIEQAKAVTIFDHHKTAQEDLKDLPNATTVFDMGRSGAGITWDSLFPGRPRPHLIDHIEDRDLWRWKLPMSREVTTAVYSYPMTFEAWDELMKKPILELEQEGRILLRKYNQDVAALVENASFLGTVAGIEVPIANVPWMYASDVAGQLAQGHPFAATYYDDENGRRWSLRSAEDGADVRAIAELYGGGGHVHAAGFRMTREEALAWTRAQVRADSLDNDELDEDSPLWLVNEQIKGLLEGLGADEDHKDVLNFFMDTGLPNSTAKQIHQAIACNHFCDAKRMIEAHE